MAKKLKSTSFSLSQVLIIFSILIVLAATLEAVTQNDFTSIAPTQLFLVSGVLGILALYIKGERT